ncbi:hypothetical protein FRC04_002572 [Tulasnella sp. 424]|nr:hypothetical protein FRC04_002572 [Tulasnella sp. 424]KAG8966650.1 hypothetical protein FRC05_002452 [Tulasnella sp. 425]
MSQTVTLLPELWPIVIAFLANPFITGEMPFSSRSHLKTKWTLQSTRAIRNACLVSRFHYQIANPFRFAIVSFVASDRNLDHKLPVLKHVVALLEERPHMVKWIRKLYMGKEPGIRPPGQNSEQVARVQEYSALGSRLHSLFLRMSNVQCLHLVYLPISPPIYFNILQSTALKKLHLEGISFSNLITVPSIEEVNAEGLDLQVLNWASPVSGRAEEAAVALIARSQNLVEMQCWTPEGTDIPSIIERRVPNQVFRSLRTLIVTVPPGDSALDGFLHLGLRCPSLKSLQLHRSYQETPRQLADRLKVRGIKARHFSSLQTFKGPLPLAVVLGKDRPIHEFWIDGEIMSYEPQDDTRTADDLALLKSKVDVTYLYLGVPRWDEDDFEAVARRCPRLETFTYESRSTDQSVLIDWPESREASFRKLKHVKRFGLSTYSMEAIRTSTERAPTGLRYNKAVENISQSNPALEYVWIGGAGSWTRGSGWTGWSTPTD